MHPGRAPVSLFRYAPAILVAVTVLIITVVLFAGVRRWETALAEREFSQEASVVVATIRQQMLQPVDTLKTLNQFFQSVDKVDRDQFHAFATPMLRNNPSIRSLSFQRLLTQAELPAYEARMRKRYPNFSIWHWVDGKRLRMGRLPGYRVIDYLEPIPGNEAAFGLDVSADPGQLGAMQRARDTGLPSASDFVRLLLDQESQRSFVLLMPVYRFGAVLTDIESRRRAVIGFTSAIIRTGTLVENSLKESNLLPGPEISLALYAGGSPDQRVLAFRIGSDQAPKSENFLWGSWLFNDQLPAFSQSFNVAGKS